MSNAKQALEDVIEDLSVENLIRFFRAKSRKYFAPRQEDYRRYDDDDFTDGRKIGEMNFPGGDRVIICSFRVQKNLTERSGKKAQYEKAKKVLKSAEDQAFSAGIFIFYDSDGKFRFSLVYPTSVGQRRKWSSFRRFTYFASKEITNKTFLQRIGEGDFSNLENIKEAFSVEKVTEEFYKDIANWYFWAVDNCRFPKEAEAEENGRHIAVIRLITRIIFIWFMRERGLVPKELFEEKNIREVLKNTDPESSTYYRAILQNLFFATLSTKPEEREFRDERRYKGINKDFGNQYVYRYHDLFTKPEKIEDYFCNMPFLNGGLFECLDDGRNDIYIDGFTERKNEFQPDIPNFLFFGEETKADLNSHYGTKGKTYRVRGLLNILTSFNFTIDENSPDDADVALDPELLGRVFENLLASFNPETATTARKATGSYYTPREIVDYMVTESLKAYFKTHLEEVEDIDGKLEALFANGSDGDANPFGERETKNLVKLIEDIKIVDPAVGSGAFPMGILKKLVFVLGKLDPGNELWKQAQLNVADTIPDPNVRQEAKEKIQHFFDVKNIDYLRKLYLIQRCIYGVDIQQIAVEIAKLRFFISLLVDEETDSERTNWGIEPLPNLEFKIMQGNSLISEFMGINFDSLHETGGEKSLFQSETKKLIEDFRQKKDEYLREPHVKKKKRIKDEIEALLVEIFESKLQEQKSDYYKRLKAARERASQLPDAKQREEYIREEEGKLNKDYGFDIREAERKLKEFSTGRKTKPFFLWDLYFSEVFHEKGGFDVVIANPPYGFRNVLSAKERKYFRKEMGISFPSGNIAELFISLCYDNLVRCQGTQTFIIPKKSLYGQSWKKVRQLWFSNKLLCLMDASQAFKNVLLEQVAYSMIKEAETETVEIGALNQQENNIEVFGKFPIQTISSEDLRNIQIYRGLYPELCQKIASNSVGNTSELISGDIGISNITSDLTFEPEGNYPCVKGIDILKYGLKRERYLKGSVAQDYRSKYQGDKIVAQEIIAHVQNPSPHIIITIFYDDAQRLINDTCVEIKVLDNRLSKKFLLGYLQSTLCNWYAYNLVYNRAIRTMHFIDYYITQIPIPKIALDNEKVQKTIIEVVDKILSITKDEDYPENTAKQAQVGDYEKEIDRLVYELYGLTEEEIKVIENSQ